MGMPLANSLAGLLSALNQVDRQFRPRFTSTFGKADVTRSIQPPLTAIM
jgi:hypothetical protein